MVLSPDRETNCDTFPGLSRSVSLSRDCDQVRMQSSDSARKYPDELIALNMLGTVDSGWTDTVPTDLRIQKVAQSDCSFKIELNSNSNLSSLCNSPMEDRLTSEPDSVSYPNMLIVKPPPRMLKFPPCEVCSGSASGQHYGSNTCEACKNFFRRYLLRNKRYTCPKDNNCVILSTNKGNCSECRLEKCLKLGMAKGKSKMGRYSYSRRTETINKVRKLEGKDDSATEKRKGISAISSHSSESLVSNLPTDKQRSDSVEVIEGLTTEEINVIDNMVKSLGTLKPWGEELDSHEARQKCIKEHYEKHKYIVNTFGNRNDIPKAEYQCLLRNHGIDLGNQLEYFKDCAKHWDRIVGHYCKFAKHIPGFAGLSCADQEILLKSTYFDFFTLIMHEGYHAEFQVYIEINGKAYHKDEIGDKFFPRSFIDSLCDLSARLQRLKITKQEMVLLVCIVTLSSDNYETKAVENVPDIQKQQECLTNLLIKLLKTMYGEVDGMRKFTKLIDCMLEMRSLGVVYTKEYSGLCQDKLLDGVVKEDVIPKDILQNS